MSAKKLGAKKNFGVTVTPTLLYCILELTTVFSTISSSAIYKNCTSGVNFEQFGVRGFGFKISMESECVETKKMKSCPMIDNPYEMNHRMVFVMRLLGLGLEGLKMFCGR